MSCPMNYKRMANKVVVRIDSGEEIVETLRQICTDLGITFGTITGIGATNRAIIGLFDMKTKKYHSTEFTGDYEISLLYGNISTMDGKPYLHIHANLCDIKHESFGGHLESAIVSATFEAMIDILDGNINRKFNEETGLNLMEM